MSVDDAYRGQARAAVERPGERSGEHWSGPPEMVDALAGLAATGAADRVLDVGCGIGGPARRLAVITGCRVVGVDRVADVVAEAARRTPGGLPVTYVRASAVALPFRARVFTQSWCLGVLAHIPDRRRWAGQLRRVVTDGGVVVVTEALWDGLRPPRFAAVAPRPWSAVTPGDLLRELADAGFADGRLLPWPGRRWAKDEDVAHPELREDLLDGRLRSTLLIAR